MKKIVKATLERASAAGLRGWISAITVLVACGIALFPPMIGNNPNLVVSSFPYGHAFLFTKVAVDGKTAVLLSVDTGRLLALWGAIAAILLAARNFGTGREAGPRRKVAEGPLVSIGEAELTDRQYADVNEFLEYLGDDPMAPDIRTLLLEDSKNGEILRDLIAHFESPTVAAEARYAVQVRKATDPP